MKTDVGSWMTKRPIKIDKNEDVRTAAEIMRQECISHLLVFDDGWLAGVFSDNDLQLVEKIERRFQSRERPQKITVGDLMSRQPTTINKEASMAEAIRIMEAKHFRSLPVVDSQNKLLGIITQ